MSSALKPPLKDFLFLGDMKSLITNPTWIMFFQTVAATTPSSGGVGATGNLRLMGVWTAGVTYQVNDIVKGYENYYYLCISTHTAVSTDEPGVGLGWSGKWDQFGGGALQRKYYSLISRSVLTIPLISATLSVKAESKISNANSLTALDVPSIGSSTGVNTYTNTAEVTISQASPAVVSLSTHGLAEGKEIFFRTTGTLPAGLTAFTHYFVKTPLTDSFNISLTSGGTAINTTSAGSGTHRIWVKD